MIRYRMKQNVQIDEVDINSEEFCFDYSGSTRTEEKTVTTPCLPPILYVNQNRYVLIWGRNSFIRHAQLGEPVPWVLLVEGFPSVQKALLYSIEVKAQTGGFTVVEKALALKRLYRIGDTWEDWVYDCLDIPRNNTIIQRYLTLADAPAAIKEMVHSGVLHENTVFEILSLESALWASIAEIISGVALGTKKRNEIVVMLRDIARRDGKSLRNVVESGHIQAILNDSGMDPSHRGEKLYRHIRDARYPSIHEFRERFNKKLKEVKLNRKFHLQLPENFEKWEFRLVIPFSSHEDFRESIQMLQKTSKKSSFNELMNMRY